MNEKKNHKNTVRKEKYEKTYATHTSDINLKDV